MGYAAYVTIGIPVRIDSPERKRNLNILLQHATSSGVNVHVLEAGERRGYFPIREDNEVTYSYTYDESAVYYKTAYVNSLLKQTTTPVAAIWDADTIFPLSQLEVSAQVIMEQDYALSIPYNGVVKMLSGKQSKAFEQSGQEREYLAMQGYTHLMKCPSCGGVFTVNREAYLRSGGGNECFISWGPEDAERIQRMEMLGYPVHWVKDGPLYHLWHPGGENSGCVTEKLTSKNRMEPVRVCSMKQSESDEYIKSRKENERNG